MAIEIYTPSTSNIIHQTAVDFILRPTSFPPIHLVQYDQKLPIIAVKLYNNGMPFTLPTNVNANVLVGKKDGTFVSNPVLGCDTSRTVIYFEATYQMLYYSGNIKAVIELKVSDVEVASSSPITMVVDKNPMQENAKESSNEYKSVEQFMNEALIARDQANESKQAAALSEQKAKISEQNAYGYVESLKDSNTIQEHLVDSNGTPILDSNGNEIMSVIQYVTMHDLSETQSEIGTLKAIVGSEEISNFDTNAFEACYFIFVDTGVREYNSNYTNFASNGTFFNFDYDLTIYSDADDGYLYNCYIYDADGNHVKTYNYAEKNGPIVIPKNTNFRIMFARQGVSAIDIPDVCDHVYYMHSNHGLKGDVGTLKEEVEILSDQNDINATNLAPAIKCISKGKNIKISDSSGSPLSGLRIFGRTIAQSMSEKNLFELKDFQITDPNDPKAMKFEYKNDGIILDNSQSSIANYGYFPVNAAHLEAGKTYTSKIDVKYTMIQDGGASAGSMKGAFFLQDNINFSTNTKYCVFGKSYNTAGGTVYVTFTLGNDITDLKYIVARVDGYSICEYRNMVIVEGEYTKNNFPIQGYEPYPEPFINIGGKGNIEVLIHEENLNDIPQAIVFSTQNGLSGIQVNSNGTYTDENNQQWVCDELDIGHKKYIKRIGRIDSYNGEAVSEPYMSSTGSLSEGANVYYILDKPVKDGIPFKEVDAFKKLHTNLPVTEISNDEAAYMEVIYTADTDLYIQHNYVPKADYNALDEKVNSLMAKKHPKVLWSGVLQNNSYITFFIPKECFHNNGKNLTLVIEGTKQLGVDDYIGTKPGDNSAIISITFPRDDNWEFNNALPFYQEGSVIGGSYSFAYSATDSFFSDTGNASYVTVDVSKNPTVDYSSCIVRFKTYDDHECITCIYALSPEDL